MLKTVSRLPISRINAMVLASKASPWWVQLP